MSSKAPSTLFSASRVTHLASTLVGLGAVALINRYAPSDAASVGNTADALLTACAVVSSALLGIISTMFAMSDRPLIRNMRLTKHFREMALHVVYTCIVFALAGVFAFAAVVFQAVAATTILVAVFCASFALVHSLVAAWRFVLVLRNL